MKVNIIGAGIGGLTTAHALLQKGIEVCLFEQAPEIKPVGAGILLAINAMQVYDKLGLRNSLEACGNLIHTLKITRPDQSALSIVDLRPFEQKYGVQTVAIHRGALQQTLAEALPEGVLKLGKKLKNIRIEDGAYTLDFEDGTSALADMLIGADGIQSRVRQAFFPESRIRHAGQFCWRGVTDYSLPETFHQELNEAWGPECRFGFVQLMPGKVYWFALKTMSVAEGSRYNREETATVFSAFHSIISDIIRHTPEEAIHTAEITDLNPLATWVKGKAALLGDAAHATTPNLGQGACQAIEDAYVLAEYLSRYAPEEAFRKYQQVRMKKALMVVRMSWTMGKMAHIRHAPLTKLRDVLMRMTPEFISRRQSDQLYRLTTI